MKFIGLVKHFNIKAVCLIVMILLFSSCNTTHREPMDHFLTGKIISIDSTNDADSFNFVMASDSSDKQIMVISSEKLASTLIDKKLRKGQHVKVKGDKVKYIRNGKEEVDAANVLVINHLEVVK